MPVMKWCMYEFFEYVSRVQRGLKSLGAAKTSGVAGQSLQPDVSILTLLQARVPVCLIILSSYCELCKGL